MAFKKGQSGNPSGRPKGAAGFGETIRKQFGDGQELLEWMMALAKGAEKEADRISAIKFLVEHGYGKPIEHHEHSGVVSLEHLIAGSNPQESA